MAKSGQNSANEKYFHFTAALQSGGWMTPAYIGIDEHGTIQYLSSKAPEKKVPIEFVDGIALPGFRNAHSHAFQYAMAGTAEKHQQNVTDDFWSWREAMYRCALNMNPDHVQAVATMLYSEMLRHGYTHVAEFQYLHHDYNGARFSNSAEMCVALLAAASIAGIKITLVPVFYQRGGFGAKATSRQQRFTFENPDEYFRLLDDASSVAKTITTAKMGFGVHSLRAAEPADVLHIYDNGPSDLPFHLHAAEQLKEVSDSVVYLKQRPVEWLLNNLPVSERFNIVHCTHLTSEETEKLAKSKANVVLCPGTEGNLGDGIFTLSDYAKAGGNWCIGTDSHISLNPLEDLRWLDYAQRLITHKRNTFNDGAATLVRNAVLCGSKAMGSDKKDYFEVGDSLDAIVFDTRSPLLSNVNSEYLLPKIVYTTDSAALLGTLVNGKWIIKNGSHQNEQEFTASFLETLHALAF